MTTIDADSERRFLRDKDHAMLGGVCAGLAGYLGFNLRVTRILAFIALLAATPVAVIGYLAAVFLIPSASGLNPEFAGKGWGCGRRRTRKARRASRKEKREPEIATGPSAAEVINSRCRDMDERLARLEKLVTSRRFQLEQELSRL